MALSNNTPKLILIILTGATIRFCQVQVSKYNWMWKAIFFLNLLFYFQHKKGSHGPGPQWELGRTWPWAHINTGEEVASGLSPGGCRDLCGQSVGSRDDGRSSNVSQWLRGGHWGDAGHHTWGADWRRAGSHPSRSGPSSLIFNDGIEVGMIHGLSGREAGLMVIAQQFVQEV